MTGARHVLCFGEVLLRLSPTGRSHLFQEPRLEANFGGAEANVAVALARIGEATAFVSALPNGPVGDAAQEAVRRAGVDTREIVRGDGRLGIYYYLPGAGVRNPQVVYDRAGSLFADTPSSAYDWPSLLTDVSWLHLSGITPAIDDASARLSLDAIAAARDAGVRVAFDGNFRESMWRRWCDDPAPILADHVSGANLLFGNHRDIALVLNRTFPAATPAERRDAARATLEHFAGLDAIASTSRRIIGPGRQALRARVDRRDEWFETDELELLDIVDRIGTGDAFAAGVLARIDDGPQAAATTGLAMAALKHATVGDQSITTLADLLAFDPVTSDVRR